ncbi:MAG: DUF882 domain-containing protein [Gammaproteobacteria bacterium]|nr:DUF882 domain-containing protein [Gammaproteobacteria bacterium]
MSRDRNDGEPHPVRRRLLAACAGLAGGALLARGLHAAPRRERHVNLLNLHTDERVRATFWADGRFDPGAVARIHHLLRDHRTGEQHPIDPDLLVLLDRLQSAVGRHRDIHVVSGYRSPRTNAMLRKSSNGVAKRSLHMQGKAIDIRVPHLTTRQLFEIGKRLQGGGVGLYPESAFVHLDTGRVRYW